MVFLFYENRPCMLKYNGRGNIYEYDRPNQKRYRRFNKTIL